jgi:hypothetical protein
MRILTVRQPWAWAIIHGYKDVENRVTNIAGDYTGPMAIHAGLAWDDDGPFHPAMAAAFSIENVWDVELERGAIIGVVDLVRSHPGTVTKGPHFGRVASCFEPGKEYGLCSSWAEHDHHHLQLANPRPLANPIPFKGALGLRRLDAETIAAIEKELS